ncbi:MAG TPA: hypothetical protein DIT22_06165 [Thermodesulfobacterium commune]|uniref:Uncharacterized protein n=1 Tax=Thermodesulfobacterium commune TaxID=1741 RepID=A0A3B8N515_9BACT|nr:hypothetical protein [Thermodesulfobacterium commune]HBT03634.1 hypothetical protein [Thermodesulfobacterium commune]HCP10274.1 hypothetical protein [Thermodesulfobacterium commune]
MSRKVTQSKHPSKTLFPANERGFRRDKGNSNKILSNRRIRMSKKIPRDITKVIEMLNKGELGHLSRELCLLIKFL